MDGRDAPRFVLGVNAGPHDASAALLRDGQLVAMVEQERLSGNKRAIGEAPADAIAACLGEAGIGLDAVAEVAVGWDIPALAEVEGVPYDEREFGEWMLGGAAGGHRPPLRFVDHHTAHAASALYTSGFEEAAILVVDGRGEDVATTVACGGPRGIEVIDTWAARESLGHLYGCASAWAGLGFWGAGKLMGLAAYGRATQPVPLAPSPGGYAIAVAPPPDSPPAAHLRQLRIGLMESFRRENFPFAWGDPAEPMAHADFAASVQRALEEALLSLARRARRESGCPRLVMAGGVALNCTANRALIDSGIFEEVWVPPFPHDAGVSLGAALVADRAARPPRPTPPRLAHALWAPGGEQPAEADVEAWLPGCEIARHGEAELADAVARDLEEGKLVAWCQGRAEVGQRALGARSVLCDPRRRRSLVRANEIKGREAWRPLAPAVATEQAGLLFDGRLPAAADFMLTAWTVREEARSLLPAAVHVDGSARPQAVGPQQTRYHGVIGAFHERTGVPAVINTSFNLAGQPIVLSPRDAAETFVRSDLDVLVLGDLVARKPSGGEEAAPRQAEPELDPRFYVPWTRAAPGG